MNIEIRHQISDTEEEIYTFSIDYWINYRGIQFSHRNNKDDVFGYDWCIFYRDKRKQEIADLYKKYDIDEDNYTEDYQFEKELCKLEDKYNPIANKTIHGKTYLRGTYGNNIYDDHPLKISKSQIIEAIIEKVKGLEIR